MMHTEKPDYCFGVFQPSPRRSVARAPVIRYPSGLSAQNLSIQNNACWESIGVPPRQKSLLDPTESPSNTPIRYCSKIAASLASLADAHAAQDQPTSTHMPLADDAVVAAQENSAARIAFRKVLPHGDAAIASRMAHATIVAKHFSYVGFFVG